MAGLQYDERGFLTGKRIDKKELSDEFKSIGDSLDSIDRTVTAIQKALLSGGLKISVPAPVPVVVDNHSPESVPAIRRMRGENDGRKAGIARPIERVIEREKTEKYIIEKPAGKDGAVISKMEIPESVKPAIGNRRSVAVPKTAADNVAKPKPELPEANKAKRAPSNPEEKAAADQEKKNPKSGGNKNAKRDASGRFTSGDSQGNGIGSNLASEIGKAVSQSLDDAGEADPMVKAVSEVAAPISGAVDFVKGAFGDSKEEGWLRKIFGTLGKFRKEQSAYNKAAKDSLETIEDNSEKGGGVADAGGGLLDQIPMVGPLLAKVGGLAPALLKFAKGAPILAAGFTGLKGIWNIFDSELDDRLTTDQKNEKTGKAAAEAGGALAGALSGGSFGAGLGTALAGPIGGAIGGLVGAGFGGLFGEEYVSKWLEEPMKTVVGDIRSAFNAIGPMWDSCISGITNAWDSTVNAWNATVDSVKSAWTAVTDSVSSAWTATIDGISSAWNSVTDTVTSAWATVTDGVTAAWNGVTDYVSGIWDGISSAITSAWDGVTATVMSAWDSVTTALASAWDSVMSGVTGFWDKAKKAASDQIDGVNSWLKEKTGIDVGGALSTAAEVAKGTVKGTFGMITDWFKSDKKGEETPAKTIGKSAETATAKDGEWTLGQTSAQFESGGRGAGTISSGRGDRGGKSYGTYQLASNTGTLQAFLNQTGYGRMFDKKRVGSKAFDAQWKELAKNDPDFAKAQHDFVKRTHYDRAMSGLSEAGIDLSGRGKAVQDAVWSTSVQFGAGTAKSKAGAVPMFKKALAGRDVSRMSDEEIVAAIQDYKLANNDRLFANSSADIRAGTAKRAVMEKERLIAMAQAEKGPNAPKTAAENATLAKFGLNTPTENKPAFTNPIDQGLAEFRAEEAARIAEETKNVSEDLAVEASRVDTRTATKMPTYRRRATGRTGDIGPASIQQNTWDITDYAEPEMSENDKEAARALTAFDQVDAAYTGPKPTPREAKFSHRGRTFYGDQAERLTEMKRIGYTEEEVMAQMDKYQSENASKASIKAPAPSAEVTMQAPKVTAPTVKAPEPAPANNVQVPMATNENRSPTVVRIQGDVGQDVKERGIAHIVTGGISQ